jgi:hypothetical protein
MAIAASDASAAAPDPARVIGLLHASLARTVPPQAMAWLDDVIGRQRGEVDAARLATALGLAGRRIGRGPLSWSDTDLAAARQLRAGWQPELWGTDEAARVVILLATYRGDDAAFAACVDRLCATAEITELVAYLKGFAVFPASRELYKRAREGARASMRPPFDAIACHNPYPYDHFDDAAWSQMVVKCVFVGAPIASIYGLQERRNPEVVQMLRDLIAERNAAGRSLPEDVHRFAAAEPAFGRGA